ncbi:MULTISPECIES: cytochrome c [unclassified Undibacterium]|uniref:c-type cytochrome n=1 Tax=unclassified Undibacterium TaxID=2630295 RepID=UPI002AC8C0ED|nr:MULTISPECIES: cytochrome c [unclassified Undibacterium]MEB0140589.1 cytochrome c [Undibacterium sp. CCC2.1]MEB0173643.1 cytochrome c [Undibacterium sp. CCC1.1]MEB0177355.1 cytochrome c [Undibacterium sp. CCC3.4]MEB0216767.1 cytochrome c [Undibacterium sp. 5I2]WPX44555.1 cytochrome c [Undibacterium sp. CCC3.4]
MIKLARASVSTFCASILLLMVLVGARSSAAATLELQLHGGTHTLSDAQLRAMPGWQTIVIDTDPAYHGRHSYQALPLKVLLPALPAQGNLLFTANDGFVATIPNASFLGKAQAWLALENPAAPWPALAAGKPSAGPLYLIWTDTAGAHISSEQWPYQIAKIAETQALEQRYPQLQVHADAAEQGGALRGLQVFAKNCATCHSLNGGGDAHIGPDLNLPYSPTEYFEAGMLRRLIRQPAAVRSWAQSSMPGFSVEIISAQELDDLLLYLRQMARQRQP